MTPWNPDQIEKFKYSMETVVRKLIDNPERAMQLLLTDKIGQIWTQLDAALVAGFIADLMKLWQRDASELEKFWAKSLGVKLDSNETELPEIQP